MDGEIENLKKSIIKEQERNENLTMLASKAEADIKHVCHQIEQSALKKDLLQKEYITFTSMLHEAEQSLSKTATVSFMKDAIVRHGTNVKLSIFVLSFDHNKEMNDPILGCPSRYKSRFLNDIH